MTLSTTDLTRRMLREEWRLHNRVVGSRAIIAFPPLILLGTLSLLFFSTTYGIAAETLIQLAHITTFVVGFHLGNTALGGRDSTAGHHRSLTLLLDSSQTLPLSAPKLVSAFLLKTLLYYGGLLIIPLALGFLSITSLTLLPALLVSFTGLYLWGVVAALLGLNILHYGVGAKIALAMGFAAVTSAWLLNAPLEYLSPHILTTNFSPLTAATSLLPLLGAAVLGIVLFSPTIDDTLRKIDGRFQSWSDTLPTRHSSVAARTLLNVVRGEGGLIKLVVSVTLVFGFCLYLFSLVESYTAYDPHIGVGIASLLSLESLLVYTWLVQFDSFDDYAHVPMNADTLVYGKTIAFAILAFPLACIHYFIAALMLNITPLDALLGGGVLIGFMTLFFGVAFALAQFEPHQRLIHPGRFVLFLFVVFAPLLLVFTAAFTVPSLTSTVGYGIIGMALLAFIGGLACLYYAANTWIVRAV